MKENTIITLLVDEAEIKNMISKYLIDYIDDSYATFDNIRISFNVINSNLAINATITMSKDENVDV